MDGPSNPAAATPITVVSPQFCVGYNVDLNIARKVMTLKEGDFEITDANGIEMFRVKGKFSLRDTRVLHDAAGNPLLTYMQKVLTCHRRWLIYRGDSTDSKDLLFSVKKSSMIQFKTKLDVFLASNTKEDVCDFHVEGNWLARACTIYAGDTKNIIAQMHKKTTAASFVIGKDTFRVTVYPNVDYAFVAALIMILWEINQDRKDKD